MSCNGIKLILQIPMPPFLIYIFLFLMVLFLPKIFFHISISNSFVSSKIYDKRDDFDIDNCKFSSFGWRCSTSSLLWSAYFSQLIRFSRVCSHVEDFNARNKCLTAKLLKQVIDIIILERLFQVLSPTLWINFKIQCLMKISFTYIKA